METVRTKKETVDLFSDGRTKILPDFPDHPYVGVDGSGMDCLVCEGEEFHPLHTTKDWTKVDEYGPLE